MSFRKIIFWIHLASGLVAGVVVAIMSITGIGIAFEEEILHWVDRHQSTIEVPENTQRLGIAELKESVLNERPEFPANYIVVPSAPDAAYQFFHGRDGPVYVNPYTGEIADTRATSTHDFIHALEAWHRFFGMTGDETWLIGRYINGICNLAFLLLCLTGLYLWFPRVMKWRLFKKSLFFNKKAEGKARNFNWHNVFGIWSLPFLVILSATAVIISFEWGHKIPFRIFGEKPPESRNFGMMAVPPAATPAPAPGAEPLSYEEAIQSTKDRFPDWVSIAISIPIPIAAGDIAPPLKIDLTRPDYMPSRAWTPVEVDPYTGKILQVVSFQERSPGLRARIWARFLHTGAGYGIVGKTVASLATAASLFLVYTGFALSYRRFFGRKTKALT